MEAVASDQIVSNVPEFTVSELSFALKREIETSFPRVRVRGEISQPSFPRSGHCYFRLKDENAVLDGVCWKSSIPRLGLRIEEGMEVIATGKLTTYAGSSRYQIIVDRLELAGEGALLKLLEDRRKKLQAEGLFDGARKRALPFLPEVVGVVTSPSGAVIRDILHRLSDRFPRRVLLWPVAVQGEKAAAEVTAAIEGFNRLPEQGPVPRPQVLIVARGGGSLEDLWAFNEEIVVRAAASSAIPLISAVGHETDTTLIDFAADRRAPTPTAAAEMAVPVRADLMAQTLDFGNRTVACMNRVLREANLAVSGLARGLGDPLRLIEERQQRLDVGGERLALATRQLVERRSQQLAAARLVSPVAVLLSKQQALVAEARVLEGAMRRYVGDTRQKIERTQDRVEQYAERLRRCGGELVDKALRQVDQLGKLLESYSFHSVLNRGFALVRDQDGRPVLAAAETQAGDTLSIQFADGRIGARVTEGTGTASRPAAPSLGATGDGVTAAAAARDRCFEGETTMTTAPLSAETVKNFLYASTATVSMQMLKRGFRNSAINGVRPLNPKAARLVGPAFTLRYIPGREDLDQPPKPGDPPSAQRQAIEGTPEGHVLVVSTEGATRSGTLGDILALRLKVRGVAGVLSDGAMRDTPVIGKMDFPVFCTAAAAPPSMNSLHPVETQTPVGICGVPVYPGDVIVADEDGAIVVPRHLADEVARDSFEQERLEKFVAIRISQGRPIPGTYPPNDETRALYQAWIKAGEPPAG